MKLGRYRHYKGKDYEVVGVGTHSESKKLLVIYKPLYDTPEGKDMFWLRPIDMFNETFLIDGKEVKRFKLIEER